MLEDQEEPQPDPQRCWWREGPAVKLAIGMLISSPFLLSENSVVDQEVLTVELFLVAVYGHVAVEVRERSLFQPALHW